MAEFSVAEFAAAVGLSTEAGKRYVGHALELRYRLPRLWTRVVSGDLPAWKARRVADLTIGHGLTLEAAAYVDRHVAPVAHKIGAGAIDRLVEEAIARFMPETAEETRRRAADGRHFTIDHDQVSFAGTSLVHGELDLADALDLTTRSRGRRTLKDLGCERVAGRAPRDGVGDLARRQLALDLTTGEAAEPSDRLASRPRPPVRALPAPAPVGDRGRRRGGAGGEHPQPGHRRADPRTWCGHPDAQVVVKPVIDLADHVHVDAYEVPDRIAEAVALRDHTCVFPWCTRPARRLRPDQHGCDCDHVVPHAQGGADLLVPARAPVPATPPAQDPRRLDLHHPRARHLPLVDPAPLPVPPRPHRHPRRHPRPPLTRPTTRRVATPPRTPPRAGASARSETRTQGPWS